jgi:hypothetical protein
MPQRCWHNELAQEMPRIDTYRMMERNTQLITRFVGLATCSVLTQTKLPDGMCRRGDHSMEHVWLSRVVWEKGAS